MLFSWISARRRRKLLADPFPSWWEGYLTRNVAHYALLSPPEQDRLRDITRILIAEKRWQGCGGLFVTEEMKVTIAAQAALLLLADERRYYRFVWEIVVFPTAFRTPVRADGWEDDLLSEIPLAGRAVDRGPVLLAWDQVLPEGREPRSGVNVVIHEFAHQLDFAEGLTIGTPPLGDRSLEARWQPVLSERYQKHCNNVARKRRDPLFTPHAADNEAEYFANASEAFYCRPIQLKRMVPDVYELLAAYYRVDPIAWFSGRK